MKRTKKTIVIIFTALMLTLLAPMGAFAVEIGSPTNLAANPEAGSVYLGAWDGSWSGTSEPMLWRVVAKSPSTITLFCDGAAYPGAMEYDNSNKHNDWSGSSICAWLNGDFLTKSFLPGEAGAIGTYGTTEVGAHGTIDISQRIVLPSVDEVKDGGWWGMNGASRTFSEYWWLRSPGETNEKAALVMNHGGVSPSGRSADEDFFVRPALNLNLANVLFTSPASGTGAKPATVTVGKFDLKSVAPSTGGPVKLTMQTLDITLTQGNVSQSGNTLTFELTMTGGTSANQLDRTYNATTALIRDASGNIKNYGINNIRSMPTSISAGASQTSQPITVNLPAGIVKGDTLEVFVEWLNGDNRTDFASKPAIFALEDAHVNPVVVSDFPTVKDASAANISATTSADYSLFKSGGCLVNNTTGTTLIEGADYTSSSGGTIITLTPTYLHSLANGTYQLQANYSVGAPNFLTLNVNASVVSGGTGGGTTGSTSSSGTTNPKTGDDSAVPLWILLLVIGIAGIGAIAIRHNKRQN